MELQAIKKRKTKKTCNVQLSTTPHLKKENIENN